jgi:hypothetical protein
MNHRSGAKRPPRTRGTAAPKRLFTPSMSDKEAQMQGMRRTLTTLATVATLTFTGLAFAADAPQVLLKTSLGDITVELNQDKAPKSSANFLLYV